MSRRLIRLDPRCFVSQSRRLRRLDQRLRLRHQRRRQRFRLLRHLRSTEPVTTVLEREEVERIVALARALEVSVTEMFARLVRTGLVVCEQEATGDFEAPPKSTRRLTRAAR